MAGEAEMRPAAPMRAKRLSIGGVPSSPEGEARAVEAAAFAKARRARRARRVFRRHARAADQVLRVPPPRAAGGRALLPGLSWSWKRLPPPRTQGQAKVTWVHQWTEASENGAHDGAGPLLMMDLITPTQYLPLMPPSKE